LSEGASGSAKDLMVGTDGRAARPYLASGQTESVPTGPVA